MKTSTIVIAAMILCMIFPVFAQSEKPLTRQEAEERMNKLFAEYLDDLDSKKYDRCLKELDEIIKLAEESDSPADLVYSMTDKKHFVLMKAERFEQSLAVALELDEMAGKSGKDPSPWNCLKIADSYLGMGKPDSTLKWMEKAVYDRGFNDFRFLKRARYEQVQTLDGFEKMIAHIEDRIGLNKTARDFSITLLDGRSFTLSSRKNKIVLIDFWATHCVPCVRELPEMRDLYDSFHEKGLEIISISLDTDLVKLREFMKENPLPWINACSGKGFKDETAVLYGVKGTPSTWLVDSSGILRYTGLSGDELKMAVEKLIRE